MAINEIETWPTWYVTTQMDGWFLMLPNMFAPHEFTFFFKAPIFGTLLLGAFSVNSWVRLLPPKKDWLRSNRFNRCWLRGVMINPTYWKHLRTVISRCLWYRVDPATEILLNFFEYHSASWNLFFGLFWFQGCFPSGPIAWHHLPSKRLMKYRSFRGRPVERGQLAKSRVEAASPNGQEIKKNWVYAIGI